MTVYMVINTGKNVAMRIAAEAAAVLAAEGITVVVDECGADLVKAGVPAVVHTEDKAYNISDMVLTIGGDGTMLHAARHSIEKNTPLLGINLGRLGFLTSLEKDELDKLRLVAANKYKVEQRSVLSVEVAGQSGKASVALNDVVLFKGSPEKSISLDIYCDDILVSRFRGDGVIFATPTGSTAYSMSAGGPILDAQLGGIVVTQICAHIVPTPPLVVSGKRVLKAVSTGTPEEPVCVSCDGLENNMYGHNQTFIVSQSDWTVPLVQFNDAAQLESIDRKLKGR